MLCAEDVGEDTVNDDGWIPGRNAGSSLRLTQSWTPAVITLVVNVVLSLMRLPRDLVRSVAAAMKPGPLNARIADVASGLLGLTASSIWKVFSEVRARCWQFNRLPEGQVTISSEEPIWSENQVMLRRLTRVALGARKSHGGEAEYVEWLSRFQMEGVAIGDKYHTREHYRDVIFLAARTVQCLDEEDRRRPLGGLGISSNFAVLVDGVPLGTMSLHGRHGSVEVICFHGVSPETGFLHAWLATWAVADAGHGGRAMADKVLATMQAAPLFLTMRDLQASVSLFGGDGAITRGGVDRHANPGTSAAEFMWEASHPELQADVDDVPFSLQGYNLEAMKNRLADPGTLWYGTEWDKLHREDKRLLRAIAACPLAEELFSVAKLMDHMFGYGDGRQVLRAAADMTNTRIYKGAMPGYTRKGISLTKEPGHLLDNLPAYSVGLRGKAALMRESQSGSHALGVLHEAGRRVTSVDLVAFTALFRDLVEHTLAPWWGEAQRNSLEVWALNRKLEALDSQFRAYRRLIHSTRRMLRVLCLLRSHVPLEDLRHLITALAYARPSRFFTDHRGRPQRRGTTEEPTWGKAVGTFWFGLRGMLDEKHPSFRGVELLCEGSHLDSSFQHKLQCLSPHCQCSFLAPRTQSRQPHRVNVMDTFKQRWPHRYRDAQKLPHRRQPHIPAWVANARPMKQVIHKYMDSLTHFANYIVPERKTVCRQQLETTRAMETPISRGCMAREAHSA